MGKYFFLAVCVVSLISCKSQQFGKSLDQKQTDTEQQQKTNPYAERVFIDANQQKVLGNIDQAAALFSKVLEKDAEHSAAMYELARIKSGMRQYFEAILLIEKAVKIEPENKWYRLFQADLYSKAGRYEDMILVYEDLTRLYPNEIDYIHDLAVSYGFAGKHQQAIDAYDKMEKLAGITEETAVKKQELFEKLGKPKKAVQEIQKLTKAHPREIRFHKILAEWYNKNNQPKQALEVYNTIATLDPQDPYIHISLAEIYRKDNQPEEAFEHLKLGFANQTLGADSKVQILLAYYNIDNIFGESETQAKELTGILIKNHPEAPQVNTLYADYMIREKNWVESKKAFENVLKVEKGRYVIWESLLAVYAELEEYKGMADYSKEAISLFPMQPLPYLYNGLSNIQLKEYQASANSLKTGLKFVVDNQALEIQFLSLLGDAYHNLKEHENSDKTYDEVLELDPGNTFILNNYSYYLALRGENLEKAEIMARKATELDPENSSNMDTYGWVLFKLEKYTEAEIWIKKSMDASDNNSGEVYEHYGDVLFYLNRIDEAVEYWIKAQEAGDVSDHIARKIESKKIEE
ncbi:MAG: tetratricopeptide repeat protein [Bacteroidales bacterium]|nr:tetratricopeptide repeat protein [Bacteroidales bacterium]